MLVARRSLSRGAAPAAAALVLLTRPGVDCFYGSFTCAKNGVNPMMICPSAAQRRSQGVDRL